MKSIQNLGKKRTVTIGAPTWQLLPETDSGYALTTSASITEKPALVFKNAKAGNVYVFRTGKNRTLEEHRKRSLRLLRNFEKLPDLKGYGLAGQYKILTEKNITINSHEMLYIVQERVVHRLVPPSDEKKIVEYFMLFADGDETVEFLSRKEKQRISNENYEKALFNLYNSFTIAPPTVSETE